MSKTLQWRIPVALAVVIFVAWNAFPVRERIGLGLDLQGGMHLVLKVDKSQLPPEARDKDVTAIALEIIRNRVDQFGVREPLIQRQGAEHLLVQLPGITDRDRALKLIGRTALLEFKLVSESRRLLDKALDGEVPRDHELADGVDGTPFLLEKDGALTGSILTDAFVDVGNFGVPLVSFELNREGAKQFGRLTGSNVNRRLAIVLDGVVQSAPVIRSRITDAGQIEGQFTREDAHDLAIVLRAGALPAPIIVEEERTVGPTLGHDSVQAGLRAIAMGAVIVIVFMLGYYWLAGAVAVFALALNLLFILGGLGYFHATLTLPGIAGIILTMGMAVDANVLIYERIREEIRSGRPLSLAISAGYQRASSAIIDSNITTLVAALFLYWFGTGPIRGFAITLGIGIAASLFTTLFVTRILFDVMLGTGRLKRLPMAQLIKQTNFDFISKRFICWAVSLVVIVIGMTAFVLRGNERYGIDFTGGVLQEYQFNKPLGAEDLRGTLRKVDLGEAVIQQFGEPTEWLIRTPGGTESEIAETMKQSREAILSDYGELQPELRRVERVGPTVGKILRQKALLAIGWSFLGILIYIAIRFRHFDFGLAALVALTHDVVIAVGALALTSREIDLVIVAALMTIAGYSVNDTIVVYDRVRENLRTSRKVRFRDIINASVNQTLARTILTSLTTLIVVVSLFMAGGQVLHNFAFALIVGFLVGTYSSIYIASGFVVVWRQLFSKST